MEISLEQKQKYLSRRDNDLKECRAALLAKDIKVLQRVGHQIKGNAATFGFDALSSIGENLELAASLLDWSAMESNVNQLQKCLASINKEFL